MVGHTGKYKATVEAMEVIDDCIGQLKKKCLSSGISLLITADHGNSDQMVYSDGSPHTSHSNSNVPFALVQKNIEKNKVQVEENKALKDVAPTVLHLLGLEKNSLITGSTIFR